MTRFASTWLGAVCAAAIAAAAVPAVAADLTIGSLPELTGPLSDSGPAFEKASRLAVEVANEAAKKAGTGFGVTIAVADPQGDPQSALSAARIVIDKGASCVLGPATTPEAIAVLNGLTLQRKITMWPTASSARLRTVKDGGTIFRTVPADGLQSKALVAAITDALGSASGKKLAIAYRNEPYGEGLAKATAEMWKAAGGTVGAPIGFDPQQASFDSEAGQLVAAAPDAYLVIDYPETYAKFGAALVRTGKFDAKKLFVSDAMSMSTVPANIPAASLEGARGVVSGAKKSEAFTEFAKLWAAKGGVENAAFTANTFDSGILCFLAAAAAKSTEPSAILAKVRAVTTEGAPRYDFTKLAEAAKAAASGQAIDYAGASGDIRFGADNDPVVGTYDVFTFQGGKRMVVKQVVAK